MSIVVTKCPQCGANIEVDDSNKKKSRCYYCGANFLISKDEHKKQQEEERRAAAKLEEERILALAEEEEEKNHIKTREEEEMEKVSDTSRIVAGIIMAVFIFAIFVVVIVLGLSGCSVLENSVSLKPGDSAVFKHIALKELVFEGYSFNITSGLSL